MDNALFQDRTDAGRRLAKALEKFHGRNAVVLGIPRGGVPVALAVARALDADLDVIVARKLGAPGQPELAIGAVTANGGRYLNDALIDEAGIDPAYVAKVIADERAEAQRREVRFRGPARPLDVKDRVVLVVDDGLATGATMRAALRSVRQQHPARLIAAVPVGARESIAALKGEADEVICPHQPEEFWAVGQFYRNFAPTEDVEVERLLKSSKAPRAAA